jgi:hypothetical protein
VTLSVKEKMLSYNKAQKLAETWVELTTEGACEISQVEDINLMAGSSIFLSVSFRSTGHPSGLRRIGPGLPEAVRGLQD